MIRPVRATVMAVAALLALAGIGACATVGNGHVGHVGALSVPATASPSPTGDSALAASLGGACNATECYVPGQVDVDPGGTAMAYPCEQSAQTMASHTGATCWHAGNTATLVKCNEDMPCWDCHTMGNGVCGSPSPTATPDLLALDSDQLLAAGFGGTCQREECYAPGDVPITNSYECGLFSVEFHGMADSDTCWLRGMGQTVPMPGYVNSPNGLLPIEH